MKNSARLQELMTAIYPWPSSKSGVKNSPDTYHRGLNQPDERLTQHCGLQVPSTLLISHTRGFSLYLRLTTPFSWPDINDPGMVRPCESYSTLFHERVRCPHGLPFAIMERIHNELFSNLLWATSVGYIEANLSSFIKTCSNIKMAFQLF